MNPAHVSAKSTIHAPYMNCVRRSGFTPTSCCERRGCHCEANLADCRIVHEELLMYTTPCCATYMVYCMHNLQTFTGLLRVSNTVMTMQGTRYAVQHLGWNIYTVMMSLLYQLRCLHSRVWIWPTQMCVNMRIIMIDSHPIETIMAMQIQGRGQERIYHVSGNMRSTKITK